MKYLSRFFSHYLFNIQIHNSVKATPTSLTFCTYEWRTETAKYSCCHSNFFPTQVLFVDPEGAFPFIKLQRFTDSMFKNCLAYFFPQKNKPVFSRP